MCLVFCEVTHLNASNEDASALHFATFLVLFVLLLDVAKFRCVEKGFFYQFSWLWFTLSISFVFITM